MTPEQLLERLAAVRIDRSHGVRAPHKPLMLLLALGRVGSHDGRDVVPNGLALCGLHHRALDRGAMGMEAKGGGFRILVSGKVRGRSPAARRPVGLRGRVVRPSASAADAPDRRFVEWHRVEVFRG